MQLAKVKINGIKEIYNSQKTVEATNHRLSYFLLNIFFLIVTK